MGAGLGEVRDDRVQCVEVRDGFVVIHDDVQRRVAVVVHGVDVGAALDEQPGRLGARKSVKTLLSLL